MIDRGDGVYTFCQCRQQKLLQRRIKSSQIAPAFLKASFGNFIPSPHTQEMLDAALSYVENFAQMKDQAPNGLGLLARVGESYLKGIRDTHKSRQLRQQHNSYGLGKTHLVSALGLTLLQQGVQVLLVNDVDIVAELRQGQFSEDPQHYEKLIGSIEQAELLIWDDLGKARSTEWVLNQYYRIFNYRYRLGLPTCFTSNEDPETLADKLGDATASRLYAMCKGRLIVCEGPDYRLR